MVRIRRRPRAREHGEPRESRKGRALKQINRGFVKNLSGVCLVGISVLGWMTVAAAGGTGKTMHILDTVPQVYPTGFLVDTPTIIRIQEHLEGVEALDVNSVGLFRVGENLEPLGEALGFLRDDGSVDHGDTLRGDGVFSGNVLFRESSPSRIRLAVQAQAGGVPVSSPSFFLDVVTPLMDEEIGTLLAGQEAAGLIWEQKSALLGDTEEARVETVAAIRLLGGVADAGIDRDGTNIWIDYRSGVGGGLYLVWPDTEPPPAVSVAALGTEAMTPTASLSAVSGQSFDITAVPPGVYVGNNKVLIWNAGEFAADQSISSLFKKSKCPAFDVTVLYGEQCTVDSIAAFVGYGTILILAHGNNVDAAPAEGHRLPGVSFLTGEDAGENSLWNKAKEYVNLYRSKYTKYSADLKTGRLMVYNGLRLPKKKNYFIAKWDYIASLPGLFPNSILFAGSCFSRSDQTMANAFLKRGAKAYFGFSAKAYVLHLYDAARQLFDSLIESGKNVSEAYASMPKEYVPLPNGPVPPPEAIGCQFRYSGEYGAADLQYNRDCSMMGTFDRHEVTVVWFGGWMAGSGITETELDKENKTSVPLLQRSTLYAVRDAAGFEGSLALDFPVATSRGTFLLGGAVLKLDDPLVVSLTVNGKWTMKSVPDNNSWMLECKVGPADVLGTICPVTTKPSGPPIGVTESVLAISSCKRTSLEDFSQQGNERFYKIHSYVQLRFRDRKFPGASGLYLAADVDIVSYYRVLVPSPASQ